MRLALLLFTLLANVCSVAGQPVGSTSLKAEKQDRPAAGNVLPYRLSLVPGLLPQASSPESKPVQVAQSLPGGTLFRSWKELLTREPASAAAHAVKSEPGKCVVPLIEVPLPKHFDDKMIYKLKDSGASDPMVWTPPPVCPLDDKWASTAHRP